MEEGPMILYSHWMHSSNYYHLFFIDRICIGNLPTRPTKENPSALRVDSVHTLEQIKQAIEPLNTPTSCNSHHEGG